ncbi:MAG: ABC transporter permease, partial [Flavobacterium sp.]|nr:ABC transporter permease [Flavobacterium sp.]
MKKANKYILLTPLLLWLFLFLVLPYCFILTQSVLTTDDFGKVIYHFNLDSYIKIFTNPLYYET